MCIRANTAHSKTSTILSFFKLTWKRRSWGSIWTTGTFSLPLKLWHLPHIFPSPRLPLTTMIGFNNAMSCFKINPLIQGILHIIILIIVSSTQSLNPQAFMLINFHVPLKSVMDPCMVAVTKIACPIPYIKRIYPLWPMVLLNQLAASHPRLLPTASRPQRMPLMLSWPSSMQKKMTCRHPSKAPDIPKLEIVSRLDHSWSSWETMSNMHQGCWICWYEQQLWFILSGRSERLVLPSELVVLTSWSRSDDRCDVSHAWLGFST